MNKIKPSYLLLLPLLFACQTTQAPLPTEVSSGKQLYLDSSFIASEPYVIETEEDIFSLDDAMLEVVNTKLKNDKHIKARSQILLDHIFNKENIALSYDGNANVTARQAFHSGSANCLSLTIMAYALAVEAGMNVSFQQINVPEYWVRNGQYNQLTGHINLLVEENVDVTRQVIWGLGALQIDFDPSAAKKSFSKKVIDKNTVLAMFYNNKGANAMVNNNYPLAYQYFKQATLQDNSFSATWGNLGILYRLNGYKTEAEKVYRHAISLDNNNLNALSNLALLLYSQERNFEAVEIEQYIKKIRNKNPYYHAVLADEAFYNGNFKVAEQHYKDAIELDKNEHEFYFGLAKIYYMQNKLMSAKKSMRMAILLNKSDDIDEQYIAKLNVLKRAKVTY
ncbi:tetratricopeptide repeat protein [Litorilituus sediminis]|uniref:Uncharacterized protein n=1 Tax=Litorilituus sediminis TaxID=718192 RepID=A0A4P6P5J2_9GAMM|nr:tetratricopeptide repeat protein [Litorilituus sediminis]QBG34605.1 hypothetical protein EMK97_02040 [Litorilituus sediminis]